MRLDPPAVCRRMSSHEGNLDLRMGAPALGGWTRNPFVRQFLVVLSSSIAARALLVAGMPLLARVYSPADIGQWQLFVSLLVVLSPLVTLRYEIAIVLPESDAEARGLFWGCLALAVGTTVILTPPAFFASRSMAVVLGDAALTNTMRFLPLVMLGVGLLQTATYWLNRQREFVQVGKGNMVRSFAMIGIPYVAALLTTPTTSHLIVGTICAQLVAVAYLMGRAFQGARESVWPIPSWREILPLAATHRNYPMFSAPYAFVASASSRMTLVALSMHGQADVVGLFAMALQLCYLPVTFISQSLGQVLYPRLARCASVAQQQRLVAGILRGITMAAVPWFVVFAWHSRTILTTVLGDRWSESGTFAAWLAVPSFMVLAAAWLVRLLDILGLQRIGLVMELIYDAILLGGLFAAVHFEARPLTIVALYACITALYNLVWLGVTFHVAGFQLNALVRVFAVGVALCLATVALGWALPAGPLGFGLHVAGCLCLSMGAWISWQRGAPHGDHGITT